MRRCALWWQVKNGHGGENPQRKRRKTDTCPAGGRENWRKERRKNQGLRKSEEVESYEEEFSLHMEPKGTLSIVEGQWQMKDERWEGLDFRSKGRDRGESGERESWSYPLKELGGLGEEINSHSRWDKGESICFPSMLSEGDWNRPGKESSVNPVHLNNLNGGFSKRKWKLPSDRSSKIYNFFFFFCWRGVYLVLQIYSLLIA